MARVRTPLARARGLGSAKHGVGHFVVQRLTALALAGLVLWGVASVLGLARGGYDVAVMWLHAPVNIVLAVLLVVAAFWHMQIGMRVIIEDYFARTSTKSALLVLNVFVCWLGAALSVVSLLKVAFAAGVIV
ncbi:MAG TPA: succinate dehydrogenase, hydrophobic membrane anchor protein [Caulobacteraceae bacterium]|nr:succinate dehydrogenase, hydrophobic membrane anchor protein [Caulobacteraceae bacterium]